jgi:hypothetical protein
VSEGRFQIHSPELVDVDEDRESVFNADPPHRPLTHRIVLPPPLAKTESAPE